MSHGVATIQPASIVTSSGRSNSTVVFDVTDPIWAGGAKPGKNDGSVDRACEAIRNHILNVRDPSLGIKANGESPAKFYFPGHISDYIFSRPVYQERSSWTYEGDDPYVTVCTTRQGMRHPVFVLGMPRGPVHSAIVGFDGTNPVYPKASNWVDLYGKLDSTAAATAGVRWGWHINKIGSYGDISISCPISPFSLSTSDGWKDTRQLTVDFCIDAGSGNMFPPQELFGMGGTGGGGFSGAYPWYFRMLSTNTVRFFFKTTGLNQPDGTFGNGNYVEFSLGSRTGMVRGTLQINLATASHAAFVKGSSDPFAIQVTSTIGDPTAFQAGNDIHFWENEHAPFNLGKRGMGVSNVDPGTQVGADTSYYGCCVRNIVAYQQNGVGTAQVLASGRVGQAPTDFERYFDITRGCIALFPMTDPPIGNVNCFNDGRDITIKAGTGSDTHGGSFTGHGYLVSNCVEQTPRYTNWSGVENMTVQCAQGAQVYPVAGTAGKILARFGIAIAIGAAWEVKLKNLMIWSTGQGIGSLNGGANYFWYVEDVYSQGGDSGIYAYYSGLRLRNYQATFMGRVGLRFVGSEGEFDGIFLGDAPVSEAAMKIHTGQFGGMYNFRNFNHDNEGGGSYGPTVASVICEANSATPVTLNFTKASFGINPEGTCLILLKDARLTSPDDYTNPGALRALRNFNVDGLVVGGSLHDSHIRVEGTRWEGEVKNFVRFTGNYSTLESVPMFEFTGPGGAGRIIHTDISHSMPPADGKYNKGSTVFRTQLPDANQPLEIGVKTTGRYNTPTPPEFYGARYVDDGTDGVSAYMVSNSYFEPIAITS